MEDSDDFLSDIDARIASLRPASMGFKSELDRYLDEELVSRHTENFNVLDWWKVAGTRYPTLRRIARDIYAIPVTCDNPLRKIPYYRLKPIHFGH
jgi:hypothetical protein